MLMLVDKVQVCAFDVAVTCVTEIKILLLIFLKCLYLGQTILV